MSNEKPTFARQMQIYGTPAQQQQKVTQKLGVNPNPNKISQQAKGATTQNKKIPVTQVDKKECTNFCRPTGINILPLRYSVARMGVKPLPTHLGANVTNVSLKNYKYTVRMINSGYLYLFIKRKSGKKEWVAYITNKKGYHQEFPIGAKPPIVAQNFACNKAGHSANASLITIPSINNDDAQTVYLLHAHAPLTQKMRAQFEKNADQYVSSGYWQKIDVAKGSTQQHCLSSGQLGTVALPLESFGSSRWSAINKKFNEKPKDHIGVALYDPIGITSKLNEDRNILSFQGLDSFLKKQENGFSNEHKLQTMTLIDNMKETLIANSIQAKFKRIDSNEQQRKQITDPYLQAAIQRAERMGDKKGLENLKNFEKNASAKAAAELEKKRAEAVKQATVEGDKAWEKYRKQLDIDALEEFRKNVDKKSDESYNAAARYVDDHYNWLVSSNLIKGLFYFDQSEELKQGKVAKESNGFIFHALLLDLMYGMNLLQKGKDLLNTWICEKKVSDKNLFLRAYCFNNKSLMTEYEKIFASESSAKDLLDYSKQGFTVFKEADAAFDSWLGSIEGKKFITTRDFKAFDKLFYWMSLMLNTALKEFGNLRLKTLHVSQINVVATAGAYTHTARLLYLRSGDFAQQVPLARLMYNLEFREAARASLPQNAGVNYTYRNTRATEIKNAVTLSVKGKPEITKNRILAIVGIFELLNFYFQYDAWKNDLKDKPELSVQLVGASFLVSSVAFDMLGEHWSRQTTASAAASASAFRIAAASLGTLGGITGLIVDGKNVISERSNLMLLVISVRWLASLSLTIGQAGVLASAIVQYSKNEIIKRALTKFSTNALVAFLMGARVIAGLNIITLSLIGIEVVLRKYVLDDAMEDWCQKSAFRLANSKEKKFKDADEEYEDFMKAIVSV